MRRGTTPTFDIEVDADLTGLAIHLAFAVGDTLIIKTDDALDVEIADGVTAISCTLTQEDTLAMRDGGICEVQVRAFNADGSLALATEIGSVHVQRILEDGFLGGD